MGWRLVSKQSFLRVLMSKVPDAPVNSSQAAPQSIAIGMLLAALGAIAFSGKAIIVKLAYRYQVDAVTLIMYRMLFALPLFMGMAWWGTYRQGAEHQVALNRRDWVGIVGLGFSGYYLASFLDFAGLQYISASLERLILYITPTLVMGLGWFLYGRTIRRVQAWGMGISYLGVLLVFGQEVSLEGGGVALGGGLVFLSAVSYAIYLSYSGELVQRLGSLRLVGMATSVACLFCIFQFVLFSPLSAARVVTEVIYLSLLNATLCTALPVLLVMMAIERIGAGATAQTGMVGPMSTILMGFWILGEPFTIWVGLGTSLVVLGILVFSRAGGARAA
jgi:drug/metabolite transporter (DMT)-like permease